MVMEQKGMRRMQWQDFVVSNRCGVRKLQVLLTRIYLSSESSCLHIGTVEYSNLLRCYASLLINYYQNFEGR
jgi:hypothetical protein